VMFASRTRCSRFRESRAAAVRSGDGLGRDGIVGRRECADRYGAQRASRTCAAVPLPPATTRSSLAWTTLPSTIQRLITLSAKR